MVIVLNGASHLRQLRAAIAAAHGDVAGARGERVSLDDGESMAGSFFGQVTSHDFPAELHIPEPGPIADYVRSLPVARRGGDSADFAATVAAALPRTSEGRYVITTHTGVLVCHVD